MLAATGRRLHGQFFDVGARDEGLLAGARQDDHANAFVVREVQHGPTHGVERGCIDGIEHVRPIDRDNDDGPVALDEQIVVGDHGISRLPSSDESPVLLP